MVWRAAYVLVSAVALFAAAAEAGTLTLERFDGEAVEVCDIRFLGAGLTPLALSGAVLSSTDGANSADLAIDNDDASCAVSQRVAPATWTASFASLGPLLAGSVVIRAKGVADDVPFSKVPCSDGGLRVLVDGYFVGLVRQHARVEGDLYVLEFGQQQPMGGLAPSVVRDVIATNEGASAALLEDGRVECWGNAASGGDCSQVDFAAGGGARQLVGNVAAFAALLMDGSIVSWGNPGYRSAFPDPGGGVTPLRLFCNFQAFAALLSDGSVVGFGNPGNGGDSSGITFADPVRHVVSTGSAFAALSVTGELRAWGFSGYGDLVPGGFLTNIRSVSATFGAFAAVTTAGNAICWGQFNDGGNCGAAVSNVRHIYTNHCGAFAAALNDGTAQCWGDTSVSCDGGNCAGVDFSVGVKRLANVNKGFAAIMNDDTLRTWGRATSTSPAAVDLSVGVKRVTGNTGAFAAILNDDSLVIFGSSFYGATASDPGPIDLVTAFSNSFVAVRADGSVRGFGPKYASNTASADFADGARFVFNNNRKAGIASLLGDAGDIVVSWSTAANVGGDSSGVNFAVESPGFGERNTSDPSCSGTAVVFSDACPCYTTAKPFDAGTYAGANALVNVTAENDSGNGTVLVQLECVPLPAGESWFDHVTRAHLCDEDPLTSVLTAVADSLSSCWIVAYEDDPQSWTTAHEWPAFLLATAVREEGDADTEGLQYTLEALVAFGPGLATFATVPMTDAATFRSVNLPVATQMPRLCAFAPCPCGDVRSGSGGIGDCAAEADDAVLLETYAAYGRCALLSEAAFEAMTVIPREVFLTSELFCLRSMTNTDDRDVLAATREVSDVAYVVAGALNESSVLLESVYLLANKHVRALNNGGSGKTLRVPAYGRTFYEEQLNRLAGSGGSPGLLKSTHTDFTARSYFQDLSAQVQQQGQTLAELIGITTSATLGAMANDAGAAANIAELEYTSLAKTLRRLFGMASSASARMELQTDALAGHMGALINATTAMIDITYEIAQREATIEAVELERRKRIMRAFGAILQVALTVAGAAFGQPMLGAMAGVMVNEGLKAGADALRRRLELVQGLARDQQQRDERVEQQQAGRVEQHGRELQDIVENPLFDEETCATLANVQFGLDHGLDAGIEAVCTARRIMSQCSRTYGSVREEIRQGFVNQLNPLSSAELNAVSGIGTFASAVSSTQLDSACGDPDGALFVGAFAGAAPGFVGKIFSSLDFTDVLPVLRRSRRRELLTVGGVEGFFCGAGNTGGAGRRELQPRELAGAACACTACQQSRAGTRNARAKSPAKKPPGGKGGFTKSLGNKASKAGKVVGNVAGKLVVGVAVVAGVVEGAFAMQAALGMGSQSYANIAASEEDRVRNEEERARGYADARLDVDTLNDALNEAVESMESLSYKMWLISLGLPVAMLDGEEGAYDAAKESPALWDSLFHQVMDVLEQDTKLCPSGTDASNALARRALARRALAVEAKQVSIAELMELRSSQPFGSAAPLGLDVSPNPGNMRRVLGQKADDRLKELEEEIEELEKDFQEEKAERNLACVKFRSALRQVTIWAKAMHQALFDMVQTKQQMELVAGKKRIFDGRAAAIQASLDKTMAAKEALFTQASPEMEDLSAAVQNMAVQQQVLDMADVAASTLNDYCSVMAYLDPSSVSELGADCQVDDLDENPADALLTMGNRLGSIRTKKQQSLVDLTFSNVASSTNRALDLTNVVDLAAMRANGFNETILFQLEGPFGFEEGSALLRSSPWFCGIDNVELVNFGLVFLDDEQNVLSGSIDDPVGMSMSLHGPFVKTLDGERYSFEMRSYSDIAFDYTKPDTDGFCSSERRPWFYGAICHGLLEYAQDETQDGDALRPSPYAKWEVNVTRGHHHLFEFASQMILFADIVGRANTDVPCHPQERSISLPPLEDGVTRAITRKHATLDVTSAASFDAASSTFTFGLSGPTEGLAAAVDDQPDNEFFNNETGGSDDGSGDGTGTGGLVTDGVVNPTLVLGRAPLYYCGYDFVEMSSVGVVFLDAAGEPIFSDAPNGEVSMYVNLAGPFLRTFQSETFVYNAQPFEKLAFSYTRPSANGNCDTEANPFLYGKVCQGASFNPTLLTRRLPTPYADWTVDVVQGAAEVANFASVVAVSDFEAYAALRMPCPTDATFGTVAIDAEIEAELLLSPRGAAALTGGVIAGVAAASVLGVTWWRRRKFKQAEVVQATKSLYDAKLARVSSGNPTYDDDALDGTGVDANEDV